MLIPDQVLKIALAFGLSTYACIITKSFIVAAICAILSFMIFGMTGFKY